MQGEAKHSKMAMENLSAYFVSDIIPETKKEKYLPTFSRHNKEKAKTPKLESV